MAAASHDDGRIFDLPSRLSGDGEHGFIKAREARSPLLHGRSRSSIAGYKSGNDGATNRRLTTLTDVSSLPESDDLDENIVPYESGINHGGLEWSKPWQHSHTRAKSALNGTIRQYWAPQQRRRRAAQGYLEGLETPTSMDARSVRHSHTGYEDTRVSSEDEFEGLRSPAFESRYRGNMHEATHNRSSNHSRTNSHISSERGLNLPLVLLHITILPESTETYSQETLVAAGVPLSLQENHKLLADKLTPMIRSRGILITHPGDDYELLEERLLESLGLRPPRISSCGHFLGAEFVDPSDFDAESRRSSSSTSTCCGDAGTKMHLDLTLDKVKAPTGMCTGCHSIMNSPLGTKEGFPRWVINVYAANGLLRAGAWSAAWREMERVDVEIGVWMPDETRRGLEVFRQEVERLEKVREAEQSTEKQARSEEEVGYEALDHDALEEMERSRQRVEELQAEVERLKQMDSATSDTPTYDDRAPLWSETADNAQQYSPSSAFQPSYHMGTTEPPPSDIPLSRLLSNYLYLLSQDKRNVFLLLAFLLLALTALRSPAQEVSPALDFNLQSIEALGPRTTLPALPSAPADIAKGAEVKSQSTIASSSVSASLDVILPTGRNFTRPSASPVTSAAMGSALAIVKIPSPSTMR